MGKLVVHDPERFNRCVEYSAKLQEEAVAEVLAKIPANAVATMDLPGYMSFCHSVLEERKLKHSFLPWIYRLMSYAAKPVRIAPDDAPMPECGVIVTPEWQAWADRFDTTANTTVQLWPDHHSPSLPSVSFDWYWEWRGTHPTTGHESRIMNGGLIYHADSKRWQIHT